ncbi:MAG TPA: nuclear transport factor 2 family protein [Kamptonema sp.]|nr:nuclear transport factor 2 family protein [Kamptonema sp.]
MTQTILIANTAVVSAIDPVVQRYFETFNCADFDATANLFAPDGVLNAPFEDPIVGRGAIALYLKAEAKGMQLEPQQAIIETLENGHIQIQVSGKVQTQLFGVKVSWLFLLNLKGEIVAVTIKLLASPQELLSLRSSTKF